MKRLQHTKYLGCLIVTGWGPHHYAIGGAAGPAITMRAQINKGPTMDTPDAEMLSFCLDLGSKRARELAAAIIECCDVAEAAEPTADEEVRS